MKKKNEQEQKDPLQSIEERYHFYGDVVSAYQIGGKEVLLHPGQEVSLPREDETVESLTAQGLLVRHVVRNERIYTEPATKGE